MKFRQHPRYPNQIILKEMSYWYISLWENQYYLGRASIELRDTSKRHLSELSRNEVLELFYIIKQYENALKKSFNTTNFNWTCLMNNSYKEENKNNPEPLHLHVWPRYKEKVSFMDDVFEDKIFGHHYDKNKKKYVKREFLINLADTILSNLLL